MRIRFVRYLDLLCAFIPRTSNTLTDALEDSFNEVRKIVSSFYNIVYKIRSIEDLLNETENKPFLSTKDIAKLWDQTGVIWDCPDLSTLERVFDFDNTIPEDFKIKHGKIKTFNKILKDLYKIHEPKNTTQEKLFKPFIERYKMKWSTFQKGDTL